MVKVLFAAVAAAFLLFVGSQAANNCDELLRGIISGSKVFEHCTIPSQTILTIGSGSDMKFVNVTATWATINVQPLNVIIHILGGLLTAMSGNIFVVTSSPVRNVTLHVKHVYARGDFGSAFSILSSNDVQGVTITLEDCDIDVGTSSGDRRGIGAIFPSGLTFTIEDVTLMALRSVLVVRGSRAVAAMGVAVRGTRLGTGIITSLLTHVVGSDVQVLATGPVSNIGISVYGADAAGVTLTPTNVTMVAYGSNVTTSGNSNYVASLGIAVFGSNSATVSPTNTTMGAYRSNVTTSGGGHTVASLGIAVFGRISATVSPANTTMAAYGSNVTTSGGSFVASLGIAVSQQTQETATLSPTNVTMVAYGSNVTTNGGGHTVASLGIAVYGASGATVSPTNLMMAAYRSNVTTSGGSFVASLGILSWCGNLNCRSTLTARDTLIAAQLSHITATGPDAGIVPMGLGSFGGQSNSIPATTITNATVIACSSTIVSSEFAFDVVARFHRSGSPERFQHQHPVSIANWSVATLGSTVTTVYAGSTGNCLMALPNATHNGTAPSIIRDSVLSCSGLPTTEPMAPGMLFTSNVTNRTGDEVAFLGAITTGGPFEECPIPHHHHHQQQSPTPTQQPTPSLTQSLTPSATSPPTASESTSRTHSPPPSRTLSSSPTPWAAKDATTTTSASQTRTKAVTTAATPPWPNPTPPEPTNATVDPVEERTERASVAEQQTVTVTVISSVTLSTVASAGGGGGGSGDVQAMLVVAGLRCANPGAQQAAEGVRRVLLPLDGLFGPPNASGTAGALVVVTALLVLQLAVAAIKLRIARGKDSAATLMDQLAVLRCPMVPLRAFGLLHQGVALQSMELLWGNAVADVTPIERAIAALGLFAATMVPLAAVAASMHVAHGGSELVYSAYERVWQRNGTPALLRLLVVPRGLWEATACGAVWMTAAAGASGPKAIKWGLLVFAQAIGISLLATLDGSIGCDTQIVALTVVFALAAVLPLPLRSQRVQWRTSSGLLLGLLNAVVTLSFHSTLRSTLGGHAVQLVVFMGVLSTLASIGNVVVWLAERSWHTEELALRDEEEQGTQMLVLAQDTDAASGDPNHRQQRREDGAVAISNPLMDDSDTLTTPA